MYPISQKQFFEGSIHLIYAVVIAQGFTIAGQVFLPIENLASYNGSLSAISLIFAYFFTITAWYGFFKSVKLFPHHQITRFTIMRYGIAIFNTFILYYMITLTASKENIEFAVIFLLVVVYFFMIILVHLVKSVESSSGKTIGIHSALRKTLGITVIFLAIFVMLLLAYEYLIKEVPNLKWNDKIAWSPIFLIIFFILCGWYRWIMWKEKWKVFRRG